MEQIDSAKILHGVFQDLVAEAFEKTLAGSEAPEVKVYLATMLFEFIHTDRIFSIRNPLGRRLTSLSEMVMEGDVRFNARSFQREREVHKHVGDFVLFWHGLFPKQLETMQAQDFLLNYVEQGVRSYRIAASFDYDPFGEESRTMKRLSEQFSDFAHVLSQIKLAIPPSAA